MHNMKKGGALSAATVARVVREAQSMGLTPDEVVARALNALADEIDADRCARRGAGEVLLTGDGPR